MPANLRWILLDGSSVDYEEVVQLANQIAPFVAEDDALFDEVSNLNHLFQKIPHEQLKSLTPEQKWTTVLKDGAFPQLLILVSMIFSVPVSNSFIETVFSLAKYQWTDSRNSLLPDTVKALLQTKVNFDFKCREMYSYLISNKSLLLKIGSNTKYE